jgi:hypothetical protein
MSETSPNDALRDTLRAMTDADLATLLDHAATRYETPQSLALLREVVAEQTRRTTTPPKRAHEHFTRNPDGTATCNDCGKTFTRPDGSVFRGHRRRDHGEHHDTPGVCWS